MEDDELLLATLNSTPVDGGRRRDHLRGSAGLAWLTVQGELSLPAERDSLIAARDLLQQVVRYEVTHDDLASFLHGVSVVPALVHGALTWERRLPAGRELAARVVLAFEELEQERPQRVRACLSPDCERFLIDQSRANQAKWCSMATCGNRAKARRHYQRTQGR